MREEVLDRVLHFTAIGDFKLEPEFERIETYIHRDANSDMESNISKTFLMMDGDNIIGYYSLKYSGVLINMDGVHISAPTIEISKFAIDIGYRKQKLATVMFKQYIIDKVGKIREILPIKMITLFVDSSNLNAQKVYKKFGFELATDEIKTVIQSTEDDECEMMIMKI